jgi:hypothetical protein
MWFRRRPVFTKTIMAGGVEEAVSSKFDLDKALEREKNRAFVELCRELEIAGRLKIGPKIRSGDYTKRVITLEL